MGQYIPEFSTISSVTPKALSAEFKEIARAYNSHDPSDFGVGCIPASALESGKSYYTMNLSGSKADETHTGALTDHFCDYIVVPMASTISSVRVGCGVFTSGISFTLDLWYGGSTIGSPVIISARYMSYTFTPSVKSSFAENDIIQLRISLTGTTTIGQPFATLAFKTNLI